MSSCWSYSTITFRHGQPPSGPALSVTALADSPDNGAARTTMTLAEFVKAVEEANYTYDGQGVTVKWKPSSACTNDLANHTCLFEDGSEKHPADGNNAQRIQKPNAQYQIFNVQEDVSISNVHFVFVPADFTLCMNSPWGGTATAEETPNAELQLLNDGDVTFTNCTFDKVIVSPFSSTTESTFTECDFENVYDAYAIKDIHSADTEITGCTFTKCGGAIYLEGSTAKNKISITGNTFTDIDTYAAEGKAGTRGLIQFSAAGDYSNAEITISSNKSDNEAAVLRQLNYTLDREEVAAVITAGGNQYGGELFTDDSTQTNDQLPGEASFPKDMTVYDGKNYYPTMKAALEGIHLSTDKHTLWCKPGADLGEMTHGHVCADLTVYGNGAYISGNGEDDFEVDTYQYCHSASNPCSGLAGDLTLTVYNLNGSGAWGQRTTSHTVNLRFEGCQNMNRVYLTGTSGDNNITLINCTFDGTQNGYKKASSCTLYSNAPGTIMVEDCTFTGVMAPVNLNNKSAADTQQNITVKNSVFTDCSTIYNDTEKLYAAPIRIVSSAGADSVLTVDSCTFSYGDGKASANGDILLGDGRTSEKSYPVSASIVNTAAQLQIHNPGDRTADDNNGKKISVTSSDQPASISNVVATIGTQGYTSLDAAITAAGSMTGNVAIELIADANLTANFAAAPSNNISYDLSASSLTSLTIRGASQDVKIISGVDGNDIDAGDRPYCPKISVKLPEDAALKVENLTFPDDLQFDSDDGTVVVQDCVFNGSISGYPQAKSISYLNNTFEFEGAAGNFYSGNAYPVWYKVTDGNELDLIFTGNTVIGCRGVHVECRGGQADIRVDNNHFELTDTTSANAKKTVALQLVNQLNGKISFQNNYVDAYMAICFYNNLDVQGGAALTAKNNYLVDDCKLYGSNEWNPNSTVEEADAFAQSIIKKLTGEGGTSTVTPGHTEHSYVDGVCTICGQSVPTSSTSYAITVEKADNGTVTASRTRANKGLTITLTVKPDEGYKLDDLTVTDKNGSEVKLTDKGDGKYTFTMPASAVTVKASFTKDDAPVDTGLPFTDVKADDWFYEAVKYAYDNKLMDGTSSTTFAPLMTTNRAMIVTILWRLEGSPVVNYAMNFGDVESGVWYTEAVRWAAAEGIVKGYSDTVFAPNDTVTREQLATILYRYAEYKEYDVTAKGDLTTFADGSTVSTWAADGMTWAVGAELITGKDGGKLDPTGTATRAEVATILMRLCENVAK
ncbi:S-layer homology domain-containing protein [Flavonifractor sp. An52]|uniref:S-layer homology domain-containing protein n=1 Tax=Flavonifractor sp. An52 TaxID=1965642 RepID=UPI001FA93C1F|nr:S-layer homology domain-containing protein [Flavonifractor sp. An52]